MLFVIGINTGLRISDLLNLKVDDVKDKEHIVIREKKTGKEKRIKINSTVKTCLFNYISTMQDHEYLFQSQKGENKPIQRCQAYCIINKATKKLGIQDQIGTHTLRKTFGYHHYQKNKDVAILQDIFNPSRPKRNIKIYRY